jgi:hypothetical protein
MNKPVRYLARSKPGNFPVFSMLKETIFSAMHAHVRLLRAVCLLYANVDTHVCVQPKLAHYLHRLISNLFDRVIQSVKHVYPTLCWQIKYWNFQNCLNVKTEAQIAIVKYIYEIVSELCNWWMIIHCLILVSIHKLYAALFCRNMFARFSWLSVKQISWWLHAVVA